MSPNMFEFTKQISGGGVNENDLFFTCLLGYCANHADGHHCMSHQLTSSCTHTRGLAGRFVSVDVYIRGFLLLSARPLRHIPANFNAKSRGSVGKFYIIIICCWKKSAQDDILHLILSSMEARWYFLAGADLHQDLPSICRCNLRLSVDLNVLYSILRGTIVCYFFILIPSDA